MSDLINASTNDEFRPIDNPYLSHDFAAAGLFYHQDVINRIKEIFKTRPEQQVIVLHGSPGTGKTRTLKRIEKSPQILGKNYIPVYLDSREYTQLEMDDLSFSVYKEIVEKLNKLGYEIPKPDYFRERQKRDNTTTLQLILLTVDGFFSEDKILVFVLDELDTFLENIDVRTISELIQYFKHIEKDWSKYRVILSGDRRLINLTADDTINEFLKRAETIDMEKTLDEKKIKMSITEPVKDQLIYDEKAIERITWYSGKNLYFQQLICHYLVNYLNKTKRNHCSSKDVDEVLLRIADENIAEFDYAWKNKLSINARIITSALADESITEKTGNLYVLKENKLLDEIFGENFYNEVEKLQSYGYINEMQKRRFSEFPFKIPVYGKWIQKEHPFIKTIIEHIELITQKIKLNSLITELEKTPDNKLADFDKQAILDIAKKWQPLAKDILNNYRITDKSRIASFIENFCARLNLDIKERSLGDENYFIIDIKNLKIGILEEALCFIQERPELTRDDVLNIECRATEFAQHAPDKLTLFFYFQEAESIENLVKKKYLSLVAIDENDLKRIILSARPAETSRKIILSKLSLQRVSPYKIAGPATATFYGRMDIMNKITGAINTSYAIVGARKIGKSSLLYKIKDNPPPNGIFMYMDLDYEFSNVKSYKTFLKSLQSEIERKFNKKVDFGKFPFGMDIHKVPQVIQGLAREKKQEKKRIVFIFDEIDGLIDFDRKHNYKLTRIFRTLSQKNSCQFVFSGFKQLYHRQREIYNPLYNFCEEIILKPLDREAALDLITTPMENIGIRYKNLEDRELILGYTACHPNLLQFFCKNLIERIEKHDNVEDRRTIFAEDIEKLYDNQYEDYIMNQIYMYSSLSEISQLILILLMEEQPDDKKTYSEDEIRNQIKNQGISISRNDLNQHLKSLVMRFILLDEGRDRYKFALPVFPEILKKRIDNGYKANLIKELQKNVSEPI